MKALCFCLKAATTAEACRLRYHHHDRRLRQVTLNTGVAEAQATSQSLAVWTNSGPVTSAGGVLEPATLPGAAGAAGGANGEALNEPGVYTQPAHVVGPLAQAAPLEGDGWAVAGSQSYDWGALDSSASSFAVNDATLYMKLFGSGKDGAWALGEPTTGSASAAAVGGDGLGGTSVAGSVDNPAWAIARAGDGPLP